MSVEDVARVVAEEPLWTVHGGPYGSGQARRRAYALWQHEVNNAKCTTCVARVLAEHQAVMIEGQLPIGGLRPEDLPQLCRGVGDLADHLEQLPEAVHGGTVAFPEGADVASEGETCVDPLEVGRWRPVVLPPAPPASSEAVRRVLQRNGRRDTAPELSLRRELHALGLRFLVDATPAGTPRRRRADVVLRGSRIAVHVHGCFWHRCPEHFRAPKANADWWRAKFDSVVARDADTDRQLRAAGWLPVVVWQHEDMAQAARRLAHLHAARHRRRWPSTRPEI